VKARAAQVGSGEVGAAQVGSGEVGALERLTPEAPTGEPAIDEVVGHVLIASVIRCRRSG
jgi:hypothetical protein